MSKILVVDDDIDILSVMEILLSMKGFDVEVTSRGENTLPKIESFKPDLILLDVLISGYDGRTICKQLKSNQATCHIPVIMFSAYYKKRTECMAAGADEFIEKPFQMQALLETIRHFAGKTGLQRC